MKVYYPNVKCMRCREALSKYILVLKHPKLMNRRLSYVSAFMKSGMTQTLGSLSACLCVRVWPVLSEDLDCYCGHVHSHNYKAMCTQLTMVIYVCTFLPISL